MAPPDDTGKRLIRRGAVLFSPFLLLALASVSSPQPPVKLPPQSERHRTAAQSGRDDLDQISSREEMLRNVEVRRRETIYKENLERAKEGALLGAEISDAYRKQKSLSPAELKKLGRIEKLAKSIRNNNGGDDDEQALKEPPGDLAQAVNLLAEMSENLKKKVEKTPKHVVSTSVITSANQLLELIRFIRSIGG